MTAKIIKTSAKRAILSVLFVLILVSCSFAGAVSLAWDYPKEEEEMIDGFKIYFGKTSHQDVDSPTQGMSDPNPYEKAVVVQDKTQRQAMIKGIEVGTWYFRMTAFNATQGESLFSEEVSGEVTNLMIPRNFRIIGK